MKNKLTLLLFVVLLAAVTPTTAKTIKVNTLEEFAKVIANDNQKIKLQEGVYKMRDYLTDEVIAQKVAVEDRQYICFKGNNNTIDMSGVVFEIDTELRKLLKHPIHTDEMIVEGNDNTISGLEIIHLGDTHSHGGCAFTVRGERNTIDGFTLRVQGSYPYGYGDLFGKGKDKETVIKHLKHSGFLINGEGTTVKNTKLYMRSFGHGFFIQKHPANVTLIDCYVEGEVRSTNDVLAEKSGAAYDAEFRTWTPNREGEYVVTPGYVKSLCEDGFRTYGACKNLRLINCTAKNTRGGFELRSWDEPMYLENCTAIGTERAFWLGEGAIAKGCKGDANYGPLLFVEGSNIEAEIALIANESDCLVHSLVTIQGDNNHIKITPYKGENRQRELPILVGYTQPEHGESMSPYGQAPCTNLRLENSTSMAVIVGVQASEFDIESVGDVVREE